MATLATSIQPSFYYMLIAHTCFHRSRGAADQARAYALNELGRNYLAKAKSETGWRDERNAD